MLGESLDGAVMEQNPSKGLQEAAQARLRLGQLAEQSGRALRHKLFDGWGQTGMALKLAPCFSRFVFPVAITVLGVFELVAGLGQVGAGLGPPFYGPRLATAGAIRD